MSLNGNAENAIELRGSITIPDTIHGKSAYEIAVYHGFDGTEEEWLESLKGADGKDGEDGVDGKDGEKGEKGDKGDGGDDERVDALIADTFIPSYTWENGGVSSTGSLTTSTNMMRTGLMEVSTLGRLSAWCTGKNVTLYLAEYDESQTFIRRRSVSYPKIGHPSDDCVFYRLVAYSTSFAQAELPSYIAAEYNGATLPQLFRAVEADRIKTHYAFSHIPIKSINHRGYYTAPENTLPAFRLSAQMGFPFVECDVSLTSDGVPVLLHDETINRTARNADGSELTEEIKIGDIAYADLAQYDFGIWKGEQYAGTPIPTFEEFLVLCKRLGLFPYIELKSPTDNPFTAETAATIVNIVKKYGMERSVSYISFVYELLALVVAEDKTARVGLLNGTTITEYMAGIAVRDGVDTGVNEVFVDNVVSGLTEEVFTFCQAYGWGVEVYCPNTEEDVLAVDPRVSGITSDKIVAADVIRASEIGEVITASE